MSIQETRRDDAVYSTGWLYTDRHEPTDPRPRAMHGCVKNECGLASVTVDYFGPWDGPWRQTIHAEIVELGRLISMRQERTERDWLTERGIKTVVGRWLREVGALLAFVGPRPSGMVINHKNCIKSDNRLSNLEFITQRQNVDHAIANRRFYSPRKTLPHVAQRVIDYRSAGLTLQEAADRAGVGFGTAQRICKRAQLFADMARP